MTTPTPTMTVRRLMGRTAYASGIVSAVGVAFLIAMFASFAAGARSPGLVFGWINDALAVVWGLLALPLPVALHALVRPRASVLNGLAMVVGIGAIAAIMILQSLLVVGALTFEEEIGPVSIAFLVLALWLVMAGYLGSSSGTLPHGVRMGLIAATYVGYPIWSFWLGRHLLRPVTQPHWRHGAGPERHLHPQG